VGNVSFMERLLDGVVVEWKALGDVTEYSPTRIDAALLDETSFVGVDNLVADGVPLYWQTPARAASG